MFRHGRTILPDELFDLCVNEASGPEYCKQCEKEFIRYSKRSADEESAIEFFQKANRCNEEKQCNLLKEQCISRSFLSDDACEKCNLFCYKKGSSSIFGFGENDSRFELCNKVIKEPIPTYNKSVDNQETYVTVAQMIAASTIAALLL